MSYDYMTNICKFLENDPKSLAMLSQTNKEINNIVVNTTSYTTQKNQRNYENMLTYITLYSQFQFDKKYRSSFDQTEEDDETEKEYLVKINEIVPLIDHSYLENLNTMICENYFTILEIDLTYYHAEVYREEAKMMYSIIKTIDPSYKMQIIYPGEEIPWNNIEKWFNE